MQLMKVDSHFYVGSDSAIFSVFSDKGGRAKADHSVRSFIYMETDRIRIQRGGAVQA